MFRVQCSVIPFVCVRENVIIRQWLPEEQSEIRRVSLSFLSPHTSVLRRSILITASVWRSDLSAWHENIEVLVTVGLIWCHGALCLLGESI